MPDLFLLSSKVKLRRCNKTITGKSRKGLRVFFLESKSEKPPFRVSYFVSWFSRLVQVNLKNKCSVLMFQENLGILLPDQCCVLVRTKEEKSKIYKVM